MLLFYTDGVSEVTNEAGEGFEIEKIAECMTKYGNHEAKYLAYMLLITHEEFRGEKVQDDNITIICVRVK